MDPSHRSVCNCDYIATTIELRMSFDWYYHSCSITLTLCMSVCVSDDDPKEKLCEATKILDGRCPLVCKSCVWVEQVMTSYDDVYVVYLYILCPVIETVETEVQYFVYLLQSWWNQTPNAMLLRKQSQGHLRKAVRVLWIQPFPFQDLSKKHWSRDWASTSLMLRVQRRKAVTVRLEGWADLSSSTKMHWKHSRPVNPLTLLDFLPPLVTHPSQWVGPLSHSCNHF